MTTTTVYTTAEDGYINGSVDTPIATYKTGTTIISSTSSSQDFDENRAFFFFNTNGLLPAGYVINSVTFYYHVLSSSNNGVNSRIDFGYSNTGSAGSTLEDADWNAAMTHVADVYYPFATGWLSQSLGTAAYNPTGYLNVRMQTRSDATPGDALTMSSFEHTNGNKAYIIIDYTVPSARQRTLTGVGT